MSLRSRSSEAPSLGALVIAREPLASLIALVLRHIDTAAFTTGSATEARLHLGARPGIVIADLTLRGASGLLTDASSRDLLTLALVDLEAGCSSFVAFTQGADQVVRIPFTPDELAVRVAALQRRSGQRRRFARAQSVDGFELNLDERVRIGSRIVQLGPALNSALYLLAAMLGRAVTFDDLRRLAWGVERDAGDDVVMRRLELLARRLGRRTIELDVDRARGIALLRPDESHS